MSTWYYCVTSGGSKALSHFVLQFCDLSGISAGSILDAGTWTGTPPNASLGPANTSFTTNGDPQTGAIGLKFDDGFSKNETRGIYFKLNGIFDVGSGNTEGIDVGIKAGQLAQTFIGVVEGPCLPTAGPCNQIFPIDLVLFQAQAEGNDVMLKWAGAATPEFNHFEVQHSLDGVEFESLKDIAGLGTEAIQTHAFLHLSPSPGDHFYRLKLVDVDGSYSYSPVHVVTISTLVTELKIFPNPAYNYLTLSLPKDAATVKIIDPFGKLWKEFAEIEGLRNMDIDLNGLVGGLYVVRVSDGQDIQTQLFIKQ